MYGLKPDVFLAMLRHVLTFAGGFAVAKGIFSVTPEAMDQIIGAVITIVGLATSGFFHATSNGSIPTLSTTPKVEGNIETRTIITPAKAATVDAVAEPAKVSTTVTSVDKSVDKAV